MKLRKILTALLAFCLLLSIALPALAAPEFSPGVVAVGKIKVSGTLTVRSGPGTDWPKVGTLRNGDRVEIYEIKTVSGARWGFLGDGWIKMSYVVLDAVQPHSSPIIDSGNIESLLWWKFCQDGTLYITGRVTFDGTSVNPERYGWYKYRNRITSVVFYGNTPYVPACAFSAYPVVSDEYPNLKKVTLCDSIEEIRSGAFANCIDLEDINFPAGLKEIRGSAFAGCANLTSVDLEGSSLETIGAYAFSGTPITTASLPATLRTIGEGAFNDCPDLNTLTLRDGIVSIGHYAFQDCPSLTGELYLPETIEDFPLTVFDDCPGFTSVVFNSNYALTVNFEGSQVLQSATFGGNTMNVSTDTFRDCTALTEVTLSDDILTINNSAFAGCTALTQIDLPDGLRNIYSSAFEGSGLKSVSIPDSVTRMDGNIFKGCADLVEAYVGSGITYLDNKIFQGCTALEKVTLANVQELTYGCFADCTALESIELPQTTQIIGQNVFKNCTGLTRLVIPASVTTFHNSPFTGCTNLSEIVFEGDAPRFAFNAFQDITATITYPLDNPTWTEDVMQDYEGELTWNTGKADDAEPAVNTGDLNGDDKINGLDVILLRQHIADWDVDIDTSAADVNGDGKVNGLDMIRLRQYIAGWDVTLG